MHRPTIDVYERRAAEWARRRPPRFGDRARALAGTALPGRPVVDLGCGHGPYLAFLARSGPGEYVVGLDAAQAMLDLARANPGPVKVIRAALEAPPFRNRSLGGAWARNSYVHVARDQLPLALARLQPALSTGAPLAMSVLAGDAEGPRPDDDFPGRWFVHWRPEPLSDVVTGAGFEVTEATLDAELVWVGARRARTLPDTVGRGMRILVCGLNPSEVAADAGYGYAGPTNRFWKAAVAAGLVSRPRDPVHALLVDRVGMTDLVKRATPRAELLRRDEYRLGAERVRRLVEWLRPEVVLFVGLTGWRAAVDPVAVAGTQPRGFAGAGAYVMPSTSGLNAHVRMEGLVAHMRAAKAAAER